jgi:hypothetical protein
VSLRAGTEYFGWTNDQYYNIIISFIATGLFMSILLWKKHSDKKIFKYVLYLFCLVILYNHIQFWLANVPFLNARTALFFIPLLGVLICLGLDAFLNFNKVFGLMLILFIGIISIQHFIRGFNGNATFEWYNDVDTYKVLKDMNEIIINENISKPVKLNCHWIFHPTLSYHIEHNYKDVFELIPYHKEVQLKTNAKFYFTSSDEESTLSNEFYRINEYGSGSRLLMRAK